MSNSSEVLAAFPENARADVSYSPEEQVFQRTLGVTWNATLDVFSINVNVKERMFTKRGVLSFINGLYDPLGFVCSVILEGKLFQRRILPPKGRNPTEIASSQLMERYGWDDPLPEEMLKPWNEWKSSLEDLKLFNVPRRFVPHADEWQQELHVFRDASLDAVGWVVYLRSVSPSQEVHVAFVTACSRVAPHTASTVPRLGLCAAVGAALCAAKVMMELLKKLQSCFYYSDSKIVLGYLKNETKRFVKYIERRVSVIKNTSRSGDWYYV